MFLQLFFIILRDEILEKTNLNISFYKKNLNYLFNHSKKKIVHIFSVELFQITGQIFFVFKFTRTRTSAQIQTDFRRLRNLRCRQCCTNVGLHSSKFDGAPVRSRPLLRRLCSAKRFSCCRQQTISVVS